jgi:hypothetical protein
VRGAVKDLPYYVRPGSDVATRLAADGVWRAQFERHVVQSAMDEYAARCRGELRTKRTLQAQSATAGSVARRAALDARIKEMDSAKDSGCALYTRFFEPAG